MLNLRNYQSRNFVCLIPALLIGLAGCVTTGGRDTSVSNPFSPIIEGANKIIATGGEIFEKYVAHTFSEPDENLSAEERQMREDSNVFAKTVLGGTLTIGALAALACALEHGFDEDNLGKCATHAAIGGVVGAIDGYRKAKIDEASRIKVREIDLVTQEIEERNAAAQRMLDSSRKVVEQNRERISELKQQVAQNEAQEELLAEEQKRLQANIDVMNRSIKTLEQDRNTYQALAQELETEGQDVADLRSRVESMDLQIAALEQERNALEEINQTVRIG